MQLELLQHDGGWGGGGDSLSCVAWEGWIDPRLGQRHHWQPRIGAQAPLAQSEWNGGRRLPGLPALAGLPVGVSREPHSHPCLHPLLGGKEPPLPAPIPLPLQEPSFFYHPPDSRAATSHVQAPPRRYPARQLFEVGLPGPGLHPLSLQPCRPLAPTSPRPPFANPSHLAP